MRFDCIALFHCLFFVEKALPLTYDYWLRSYNGDCNNGQGFLISVTTYSFSPVACTIKKPGTVSTQANMLCRAVDSRSYGVEVLPGLFFLTTATQALANQSQADNACRTLLPYSTLFESRLAELGTNSSNGQTSEILAVTQGIQQCRFGFMGFEMPNVDNNILINEVDHM